MYMSDISNSELLIHYITPNKAAVWLSKIIYKGPPSPHPPGQ